MSPHAVRGTGTHHTVETVERGRERGGRGTAWAMSCHATKRQRTPPVCNATLRSTSTWNSDTCAYVTTPLTTKGRQVLFVVNSVKLHLTAFKNCITKMEIGCLRHPRASTIGSHMVGKSWQPSHEPPRHAEGPLSKATASLERMGLMAMARPETHKTTPESGGTQLLNANR